MGTARRAPTKNMMFVSFSIPALLSILCVIGMIAFRSPRTCALCLLGFIFNLAGLFILLNASGVALIQIFAGIGLALALFVFAKMTEQTKTKRKIKKRFLIFTLTLLAVIGLLAIFLARQLRQIPHVKFPNIDLRFGTMGPLAHSLHTQYVVPLTLLGFLILLAVVSVVFWSRKDEG